MKDLIIIEFTEDELEEIIIDYYGLEQEEFDINEYTDMQIHDILLDR